MAKEIVIWCEVHLEREERVPGREYEVTLDGKAHTVDLCPDCSKKHLNPLISLLDQYGQPLTPARPPQKKTKKSSSSPKVLPNADGQYECDYPGCGLAFSKPQGCGRHKLAHHDYAEVMAALN